MQLLVKRAADLTTQARHRPRKAGECCLHVSVLLAAPSPPAAYFTALHTNGGCPKQL